jgi:hypothetical protein
MQGQKRVVVRASGGLVVTVGEQRIDVAADVPVVIDRVSGAPATLRELLVVDTLEGADRRLRAGVVDRWKKRGLPVRAFDSGGVYGTLNRSLFPQADANVPAGTKIDVYAMDGTTLLYSYTTQGSSAPTPYIDAGLFNTGNAPYAQGPIYLNYGYDEPYGIGSTDFAIW